MAKGIEKSNNTYLKYRMVDLLLLEGDSNAYMWFKIAYEENPELYNYLIEINKSVAYDFKIQSIIDKS